MALPIGNTNCQHFANFYLGAFDRYVKEGLRIEGYVRYMDDCSLWADTPALLQTYLTASGSSSDQISRLETKPEPYINRAPCTGWTSSVAVFSRITGRSTVAAGCGSAENSTTWNWPTLPDGAMSASFSEGSTALVAFAKADGVSSWRFRRSVIDSSPEGDPRPRTG